MAGIISMAGPSSRYRPPLSSPGNPLFIDDFDYALSRVASGATKLASLQAVGYDDYKDENTSAGAQGYIYTVTSIEGDTAGFPADSPRALAMEGLPVSQGAQTDYYLAYGGAGSPVGTYPANCWMQFWIYIQDDAGSSKQSTFANRNKFIYPKLTGTGTQGSGEYGYLLLPGARGFEEVRLTGAPVSYPANEMFLALDTDPGDGNDEANNTNCDDPPTNHRKLYQNLNNTVKITANEWFLVKMHIDVSTADQGTWEAWIAPLGGAFTKVAEWIGGVTSGFTWPTPSTTRGGFRGVAFPTTENASGADGDNWKYMQDFCFAESEADLPTYGGTG